MEELTSKQRLRLLITEAVFSIGKFEIPEEKLDGVVDSFEEGKTIDLVFHICAHPSGAHLYVFDLVENPDYKPVFKEG